jgi:hypothetical protein
MYIRFPMSDTAVDTASCGKILGSLALGHEEEGVRPCKTKA